MERIERIVNDFMGELRRLIDTSTTMQIHRVLSGQGGKVEIHRGRWPNGHSKRSPETLEAARQTVLRAIQKNPGKRSEQLQGILGMDARELMLPLKQLLDSKHIKAKGVARGRCYWAR
jgi:hypothetical protein